MIRQQISGVLSVIGLLICGLAIAQQFHVIPAGSGPGGLDPCKYFENVTGKKFGRNLQ